MERSLYSASYGNGGRWVTMAWKRQ